MMTNLSSCSTPERSRSLWPAGSSATGARMSLIATGSSSAMIGRLAGANGLILWRSETKLNLDKYDDYVRLIMQTESG